MKIAVIGAAGTLGSCAAFNIITHRLADELVLIDTWENMLKAHVNDFSTAAVNQAVEVRIGKNEDLTDSDFVIVTAGAAGGTISSRRELLPANLPIIKDIGQNIARFAPEAVIITATNPVDALNYEMYLLSAGKDRRKIIGYSLNDSFRFRQLTAAVMGVKPNRVDGIVIGEHDLTQVMLFSTLRVDGKPVITDEGLKNKVKQASLENWRMMESFQPKRTSGWTSAIGIASIIRAIADDTGALIPCNVVLEGEYGYHGLSTTVPAVLGREGVQSILELELAPDEKAGLEYSVSTLMPQMHTVEEYLDVLQKVSG